MSIVNVIDTEWDSDRLLEIGLTTVCTKSRSILKTYSLPFYTDELVSPFISNLTGWTRSKLRKCGLTEEEAERRLKKYGFSNRTVVMDTNNEFPEGNIFQGLISPNQVNISLIFSIKTGYNEKISLSRMLEYYGLEFQGRKHRADSDSFNIARLFLKVMYD